VTGILHARVWDRFWFAPGPAANLAGARVVIAAHALWILLSRDLPGISALPIEFWHGVREPARWRYLLFPGHPVFEQVLFGAAVVALAGVVLGVAPRVTCLASALLLYHLAPLETIIWTPNPYERGLDISVIALVVLAVSPCTDVWSIRAPQARGRTWSPDYNWPLRVIELVIAQVYLFAGYAKLYRAGLAWISSENLRRWLLVFNQQDQVAVFHRAGPWLAQSDAITLTIAIAAIAFDFLFVVALFWRKSRLWVVLIAIAFHLGILVSMNIAFLNTPQLLVFVNWDRAARAIRRWRTALSPAATAVREDPASAG
jgi:HTTM domain